MPPTSLAGSGAPASVTTRASTPGSGKPTVPATRSPCNGLDVFISVSDMP